MDHRPIGLFDSGLGGLTAMKALRELLPGEDIIYFGDTGRMPYGSRSAGQLRRMAQQDLDFLAACGVKAIIAACGTVSSTAGDLLDSYRLPVVGVVKAGAGALAAAGGSGTAAVIATQASVDSGAYARAFRPLAPGRRLVSVACPDLVPLIESGHVSPDDPLLKEAAARYMRPVREAGATALLLGCTHYGIVEAALAPCLPRETAVISASGCAALAMERLLRRLDLLNDGGSGRELYYTSGSGETFTSAAAAFLGRSIRGQVTAVPVMEA